MFKTLLAICLGIFNVFAVVLPGDDVNTFKSDVNNLYSEYIYLEDIETSEYSYTVVFGQMADKMTFGIYFNNIGSLDEHIVVRLDSQTLNINPDIDQIVKIKAFEAKGETITFTLRNSLDNSDIQTKSFTILDYDTFKTLDTYTIQTGLAAGTVSDITVISSISESFKNFYLILLGIIFFMSVIMIFAKTKNKGLFNKNLRSQDIEKYGDLVEQAKKSLEALNEETDEDEEEVIENRLERENNEPEKEVYKKNLKYDDIEDVKESYDIVKHLQDKGFILDYTMISEDEKNQIMLELMLLKNLNKITAEEYKKETIKLWKK